MAAKTPKTNPLAFLRARQDYEVEWEAIEAAHDVEPPARDPLGLTRDDRLALGLSPPPTDALSRETSGDANEALGRAFR